MKFEIRYTAISVKLALETIFELVLDLLRYVYLGLRSDNVLAAENLFLRKQLALYQERQVKPRRINAATRIALVFLSKRFKWRPALVTVQPQTLVRWHRHGFRLFWRWKSRPGRPRIQLIRQMALDNVSWGEERIANELLLELGIRISPRTVRKYMPKVRLGAVLAVINLHRGHRNISTFLRVGSHRTRFAPPIALQCHRIPDR